MKDWLIEKKQLTDELSEVETVLLVYDAVEGLASEFVGRGHLARVSRLAWTDLERLLIEEYVSEQL